MPKKPTGPLRKLAIDPLVDSVLPGSQRACRFLWRVRWQADKGVRRCAGVVAARGAGAAVQKSQKLII